MVSAFGWQRYCRVCRRGTTFAGGRHIGAVAFRTVDVLTHGILETLVGDYDLGELTAPERDELNLAWRRLDPWRDAVAGLQRSRGRFQIVTLANGNVSLLRDIASYAELPWHQILSAAVVKRYKRDPVVYEYGIASLGLEPGEIMMVAAHSYDLDAAKAAGLPGGGIMAGIDFVDREALMGGAIP
jgi:2-haloacid dehalogenase